MSPGSRLSPDFAPGEVIVEFVRNGQWLKCSAIHAASGVEVSAMGPATDRTALQRIALGKLRRRLSAG